jgi:hypothetical protein
MSQLEKAIKEEMKKKSLEKEEKEKAREERNASIEKLYTPSYLKFKERKGDK